MWEQRVPVRLAILTFLGILRPSIMVILVIAGIKVSA